MKNEKLHENTSERTIIKIKRSTEAPLEIKENPFYDPEFWGQAKSPENIYLPESDEAISLAIAAHEIGHLVNEGAVDADLDGFEATRAEEERAWEKGIDYLNKHLTEYFSDRLEILPETQQAIEKIKNLMMQVTDLSKDMYLEKGSLTERRQKFFADKGEEVLSLYKQIKSIKINQKINWDKYTDIVTKAAQEIMEDNKK